MNYQPTSAGVQELLLRGYTAFNARDIDTILSIMHPNVEWANGMEGGYVHGHDGVRAYWTHQWRLIDPFVEPQAFRQSRTHCGRSSPARAGQGRQQDVGGKGAARLPGPGRTYPPHGNPQSYRGCHVP